LLLLFFRVVSWINSGFVFAIQIPRRMAWWWPIANLLLLLLLLLGRHLLSLVVMLLADLKLSLLLVGRRGLQVRRMETRSFGFENGHFCWR
jgi:hypothetical protein